MASAATPYSSPVAMPKATPLPGRACLRPLARSALTAKPSANSTDTTAMIASRTPLTW